MTNRTWPAGVADWSGNATADGLHTAAASTEYSWVNIAPSSSHRASDSSVPGRSRLLMRSAWWASAPRRSRWRPPKRSMRWAKRLVDAAVVESQDLLHHPRGTLLAATGEGMAGDEELGDDPGRIGRHPQRVATHLDHAVLRVDQRRPCWAMASQARVDSAPWLRLGPSACRPS